MCHAYAWHHTLLGTSFLDGVFARSLFCVRYTYMPQNADTRSWAFVPRDSHERTSVSGLLCKTSLVLLLRLSYSHRARRMAR